MIPNEKTAGPAMPAAMGTDFPFGRVQVNEPGDPPAWAWSNDALKASDWQGFRVVYKKEEASIYTAYRADCLCHTLRIARLYKSARIERVAFAEWADSDK